MAAVETFIHGTPELREADHYYIERLVKTMLWMKGGYKIYVRGDSDTAEYLRSVYCKGGRQEFDWDYMASVFEHPFEIVETDVLPAAKDSPKAIGGHMEGCGVKYFSRDGVIKLAPRAGIELDETLSPAEKLKAVQKLMEADDPRAAAVYRGIGCYLAHTLACCHALYGCENLLLLGRVMSGKGGDALLAECRRVMADEYPELAKSFVISLPDEKFRRVGQSAAAASLPEKR